MVRKLSISYLGCCPKWPEDRMLSRPVWAPESLEGNAGPWKSKCDWGLGHSVAAGSWWERQRETWLLVSAVPVFDLD